MEILSPERVKAMLKKKGREITLEEAALALNFLRKMANIVVSGFLEASTKQEEVLSEKSMDS